MFVTLPRLVGEMKKGGAGFGVAAVLCSVGSEAQASGCKAADSGVRGYCAPSENMP